MKVTLSGRLLLQTIALVWGDWSQDARRSSISLFDVLATISSSRPNSHWLLRAANVKGGRRPSRNDLPLTVASTVADFVESGGTGVSRCISVIGRISFFGSVLAKLRRSADAAPYGLGIRAHEKPPRPRRMMHCLGFSEMVRLRSHSASTRISPPCASRTRNIRTGRCRSPSVSCGWLGTRGRRSNVE